MSALASWATSILTTSSLGRGNTSDATKATLHSYDDHIASEIEELRIN
ncbi:MAG: hypothetical protein H7A40_01350 [Chlamydiales bacterium]|nr:hypothetical protein [Chlamydiales bacterium]